MGSHTRRAVRAVEGATLERLCAVWPTQGWKSWFYAASVLFWKLNIFDVCPKCLPFFRLEVSGHFRDNIYGELSEWSMVQHWKCCVRQRTGGSNPPLSAKSKRQYWYNTDAQEKPQIRGFFDVWVLVGSFSIPFFRRFLNLNRVIMHPFCRRFLPFVLMV